MIIVTHQLRPFITAACTLSVAVVVKERQVAMGASSSGPFRRREPYLGERWLNGEGKSLSQIGLPGNKPQVALALSEQGG